MHLYAHLTQLVHGLLRGSLERVGHSQDGQSLLFIGQQDDGVPLAFPLTAGLGQWFIEAYAFLFHQAAVAQQIGSAMDGGLYAHAGQGGAGVGGEGSGLWGEGQTVVGQILAHSLGQRMR